MRFALPLEDDQNCSAIAVNHFLFAPDHVGDRDYWSTGDLCVSCKRHVRDRTPRRKNECDALEKTLPKALQRGTGRTVA